MAEIESSSTRVLVIGAGRQMIALHFVNKAAVLTIPTRIGWLINCTSIADGMARQFSRVETMWLTETREVHT